MKIEIDSSFIDQISELTNWEMVELMTAFIHYHEWKEITIKSRIVKFIWRWLEEELMSQKQKKQMLSEKRSLAWKQGWRWNKKTFQGPTTETTQTETTKKTPPTEDMIQYAEYVFMTEKEHQKLERDFWWKLTREWIENLNNRIWEKPNSKDRRNRKAYFTIRNWLNRDAKKNPKWESARVREIRLQREKESQKLKEQLVKEEWKDWRSQIWLF